MPNILFSNDGWKLYSCVIPAVAEDGFHLFGLFRDRQFLVCSHSFKKLEEYALMHLGAEKAHYENSSAPPDESEKVPYFIQLLR